MGIVFRQSIKSVLVTLAGVVLGGLVTIFSARFFPKIEYGFTQNLVKIALQVSYLALFGFNATILIFGQKYPPGHRLRSAFLGLCAVIPLGLSLVVCSAYFIAKDWLLSLYRPEDAAMMARYFLLFPLLTFLSVAISWMEGYLQSLQRSAIQNMAREVLARIIYLSLIFLYALGWIGFSTFIVMYVVLYLGPFLFLLIVAWRAGSFRLAWPRGAFSGSEVREIFRFSGYHMLSVVSTVLILQLDSILLGPLAEDGLADVAVYSVAAMAIGMMRNPTRVVGIAATPSFSQHYQEGRIRELRELYKRSAVNMQLMAFIMCLLVWVNLDHIQTMMSWVQSGYDDIKWLLFILMLGQLADMITGLNYELIGVTKYYRFNFWIALVLVGLVFGLNYYLIGRLGIFGAAWATTIGLVVFNLAKTGFLWRKLKMQPFGDKFFVIVGIAVVAGLVSYFIPSTEYVLADVVLRSASVLIIFLGLSLWGKVSPELNQLAENIWYRRRLF